MALKNWLLDAWALLMPVDCAGCGAEDRSLCGDCSAALIPELSVRTVAGLEVVTALRYEGRVRRIILALKEQDRTDVTTALSAPLAAAVARAALTWPAELALVPTSRRAYRRRGYEPVALLLRRAGYRPSQVLVHTRSTAGQKTLGIAERASNLRGAFVAPRSLAGRRFVIVDDVLTTGATLAEASRAIEQAGGTVWGAATLAFTPRLFAFRDNADGQD